MFLPLLMCLLWESEGRKRMNKQQPDRQLEQLIIGYDDQSNLTTWRSDVETDDGETGSVKIDNCIQQVIRRSSYWELDPDSQQQRERVYNHELEAVTKDVDTERNLNRIFIIIWLALFAVRTIVVEGWHNFWRWDWHNFWRWETLLDGLVIVFGIAAFASLLTSTIKEETHSLRRQVIVLRHRIKNIESETEEVQ